MSETIKTPPAKTVPLYRLAYDTILGRIVSGDLPAGAMLPSEMDLAADLGVSQGTARKALIDLTRAGVIERRQGRGSFVTRTTTESALFHFFRLRDSSGAQVLPELVSESISARPSRAADRALFGADCTRVVEIDRLRAVDGIPRLIEQLTLPATLFPGIAARAPLPNALYVLYQKAYGLAVARADERLTPDTATASDAAILGIEPGTPLLAVDRRAVDLSNRVIEHRVTRLHAGPYHYAVTLA